MLTAAGAKSHRVTRCLSDHCGWTSRYGTIWELDGVACREALTGSAHQVKGRERRGPRHQETTMPKYLLHDETTPQELAGGCS